MFIAYSARIPTSVHAERDSDVKDSVIIMIDVVASRRHSLNPLMLHKMTHQRHDEWCTGVTGQ